jgi:hypothetical protein
MVIDLFLLGSVLVGFCLFCEAIFMIVTLHNPQQGHAVLKDLWPKIK